MTHADPLPPIFPPVRSVFALLMLLVPAACAPPPVQARECPHEEGVEEIQQAMASGRLTSEALVVCYLERIAAVDRAGPQLNSVISLNPQAIAVARALDAERRGGRVRGPLHGIPILLKDNIDSADPMPTTAGSLALAGNTTGRDAPLVAGLRAAGAVILGKTNLSEWSNIRSSDPVGGWSAVGGQTRNPYVLDRSASGSSTGSAVAVSAGLAAAAVGTDTNGSITNPASVGGVVGFRPTLGLVSRRHLVPVLSSQDSPGPITRSVRDAAILLNAMAGTDPADPDTREADARRADYPSALDPHALRGRRLGVMRFGMEQYQPEVVALFAEALEVLRAAGAEVIEIYQFETPTALAADAGTVALAEIRAEIDAYLASTPPAVRTRSLEAVIAFNRQAADRELRPFGQEHFELFVSLPPVQRDVHLAARRRVREIAGPLGIDHLLRTHRVDALIAPTSNPPGMLGRRRSEDGPEASVSQLPALAGYPHLTVPMGFVGNLPIGISFIGTAWSDAALLALGYAFEQRAQARRPPGFVATEEGARR